MQFMEASAHEVGMHATTIDMLNVRLVRAHSVYSRRSTMLNFAPCVNPDEAVRC